MEIEQQFEVTEEGREPEAAPEAKPINGLRLTLQALWAKIKRAFGASRRGEGDE